MSQPQGWLYRLLEGRSWWMGAIILVLVISFYFSMCMP